MSKLNPLLEMAKLTIPLAENFGPCFAVTFKPNEGGGIAIEVVVFVEIIASTESQGEPEVMQFGSRYILTEDDMPDPDGWVKAQIQIIKEEMQRISQGAKNGNQTKH